MYENNLLYLIELDKDKCDKCDHYIPSYALTSEVRTREYCTRLHEHCPRETRSTEPSEWVSSSSCSSSSESSSSSSEFLTEKEMEID